jgi:hypothetical protein
MAMFDDEIPAPGSSLTPESFALLAEKVTPEHPGVILVLTAIDDDDPANGTLFVFEGLPRERDTQELWLRAVIQLYLPLTTDIGRRVAYAFIERNDTGIERIEARFADAYLLDRAN